MSDEKRIPRARVESRGGDGVIEARAHVVEDEPGGSGAPGGERKGPEATGAGGQAFKDAGRRMGSRLGRAISGHEHAFWGGVLGFIVGVLLFWVGPVRTLVVAVLAVAGVAVGQAADGDPRIIEFLRRFFSSNS